MINNRKPRSDSLAGRLSASKSHNVSYPTPNGRPKLRGIDRKRWKSYCLARDSWTDTELMLLYEGIICHRELDEARDACKGQEIMVKQANGNIVANPIFHETRQREKALQTWLRQIGLNTSPERSNSTNAGGKRSDTEGEGKIPDNLARLVG